MATTDQTKKPKKMSLTEQLKLSQENEKKLQDAVSEATTRAYNAEQETKTVIVRKDKEMREILTTILTSIPALEPSGRHFYSGQFGQPQPTVSQIAGELAGSIARLAEKINLQNAIIEENDGQIEWFRGLIEKVLGIKKPKVDTDTLAKAEVPPKKHG